MKKEATEVTRRDFLRTTAILTATAAAGHTMGLPGLDGNAELLAQVPYPKQVGTVPVFPYGAVYFRKSNPPAEAWARDHATAARMGMNTFRHWFLWGAIEVAPGQFDWADYDRMMDLAEANGLKVIIAEFTTNAPEWVFHLYASTRYKEGNGSFVNYAPGVITPCEIGENTEVGGFPGLCLDNPEAQAAAERFLTALIIRYRDHPALLGYDLWNENTYPGGGGNLGYCSCEGTKRKLREWLQTRYGSLQAVREAWGRYSWEWEDFGPPRGVPAASLDWLQFGIDDAFRLLKWRVDLFRRLDPHHLICAHGVAGTLESLPSSAHNEWRSAALMDVWGLKWVASADDSMPWLQYQAMDLVRAGGRGKPFWHADAEAGLPCMSSQTQVIGRASEAGGGGETGGGGRASGGGRSGRGGAVSGVVAGGGVGAEGRHPDADDTRIWNLISCASGARGILFGTFTLDGPVTPSMEMASKVAKWANSHAETWKSHPVRGDIGLVFVPESELFNSVQQGATAYYAQSIRGAYQAFFDQNIQADFVAMENIEEYKLVYLAYPVMLRRETADRLKQYVRNGGTLICEGLPAYFGDGGWVGTVQPNFGLDELFGARENEVEFDPDLSEQLVFEVQGKKVYGRYFRQDYELTGGKAAGQYSNGNIAAVENTFGKGRTLLMGSFPGAGYYLHHGAATKELFASFLKMADMTPQIAINDSTVQARLHQGTGGTHVWVTNPTREAKKVTVTLATGEYTSAEDLWGGVAIAQSGRQFSMSVPARDAVIAMLR